MKSLLRKFYMQGEIVSKPKSKCFLSPKWREHLCWPYSTDSLQIHSYEFILLHGKVWTISQLLPRSQCVQDILLQWLLSLLFTTYNVLYSEKMTSASVSFAVLAVWLHDTRHGFYEFDFTHRINYWSGCLDLCWRLR